MILDGYGLSLLEEGNAIRAAQQPNLDSYMRFYPMAALHAAGIEVGLPWGEMGNSETGHQNIGSGRVVYQNLPRISLAIQDGSFFANPAFRAAAAHVQQQADRALHIMGLMSDGGVHSHLDHALALLKFAHQQGIGERTYVHAFLDGRDSPPDAANNFIKQLTDAMHQLKAGTLATMIGRYYAMDRNQNADRIQVAYDLLVNGQGTVYPTWQAAVSAAFQNADTRSFETAPPALIGTPRLIRDGDAVIFINYRPDRAQQLTAALAEHLPHTFIVTMTQYNQRLPVTVAFPEEKIEHPLGWVISQAGLKQLRIAEGEKFAHVTHFFDGGDDTIYPGEKRIKIDSINTKDFSRHPAMSAQAISDRVMKEIQKGTFDFIVMNYANPDMVGHTGNFDATVQAIEILDQQIGRVVDAAHAASGAVLLTCDHGKAEVVVSHLTHKRTTDHTNNPVPLISIHPAHRLPQPKDDATLNAIFANPIGVLSDVAPTVLDILGLPVPPEMTAKSVLNSLR